jgi:hypothetical protein
MARLEDRVAALEDYRDHEAPHVTRAAGMGLEIVQQEVRDVSVKLTRVIGRQDQAEATLRDVAAVQQEQGRLLERIGRVLERHGRRMDSVDERLGRVDGRVVSVDERLGGVDGRLDGHGEMLADHGRMLAEILRRLPEPGAE